MDAEGLHAELWEGIRSGFRAGRLAHAYLVVGDPRGGGLRFAEAFLQLLFCQGEDKPCGSCTACRLVAAHKHADTLWIEPQSKSRSIVVADIEGLIRRMSRTAFEGGWKAGVLLGADCMNHESANKLLKTLEEPPAKTMLLLVTGSPQALLPTIVSRCQRLVLPQGADPGSAAWRAPLVELLRRLPPDSGLAAGRMAMQLKAILDDVKAGIAQEVAAGIGDGAEALDEAKRKAILEARTSAHLKAVQSEVFRVIQDWCRDVLMLVSGIDETHLLFPAERDVLSAQAARHTQGSALAAIQSIEEIRRRLERNLPDSQVYDEALRSMVRG